MAGLLILSPRVFDIVSLYLSKEGLRAEMNAVKEQVSETSDKINRLFMLTMSPAMYKNLRKLASGRFGHYKMNKGLERELYHLRDIGYIEVESIKQIPRPSGEDLSAHVTITETGKEFVELRESIERGLQ